MFWVMFNSHINTYKTTISENKFKPSTSKTHIWYSSKQLLTVYTMYSNFVNLSVNGENFTIIVHRNQITNFFFLKTVIIEQ